ncbi:MAG TPA: hypothetical protein VIO33_00130 [Burkholderiaceae bacterium]
MRDFEDSTLWRISEYDRVRQTTGTSGFDRLSSVSSATVLPSTLLADLRRLDADPESNDVLEVVAACMRHRQAALLVLQHDGLVWPVTLFPAQMMYHAPISLHDSARERTVIGLSDLRVLEAEPPGVRTPGPWLLAPTVDPAQAGHYRELQPLLWALAIDGPRPTPLSEIAGTAAYRAIRCPSEEGLATPGVYASACDKLRRETVALRTIAGWPAMNVERAGRLLNALYLAGALLVSRTHPAARSATRTGWRLKR